MTLEQIRSNIERDIVGILYEEDLRETISAISSFKEEFGYLPNDIDEWYESNT